MSKKKVLAYALLPVLGLGILAAGTVSAHGMFGGGFGFLDNATPDEIASRQNEMFANQAQILGVSVDEIKAAWASGKSMSELMSEKGISEEQVQARMKEKRVAQLKSYLAVLVEKGVITQAQADSRLKFMETQVESGRGKVGRGLHRDFGF